MSEDDDESRANRLHDRRRRSRSRVQQEEPDEGETDETDELSEPSESSKLSQPSQTDKRSSASAGSSVKDEQVGTYMYLPESLADDLAYQFKLTSAEYERELGEEFEKNRHWYPLVISLGLEQVEEMDPEGIHKQLAALRASDE